MAVALRAMAVTTMAAAAAAAMAVPVVVEHRQVDKVDAAARQRQEEHHCGQVQAQLLKQPESVCWNESIACSYQSQAEQVGTACGRQTCRRTRCELVAGIGFEAAHICH